MLAGKSYNQINVHLANDGTQNPIYKIYNYVPNTESSGVQFLSII